ncbi:DddA-like double-stranded DNA deaminase toxin [Glycomyces sp. NPDC048151]|uniref:DddA-like double-stranded DNA deaminase toxin n=1 Tax=Glycomyces sp. NPDC048151 TaxID=3364002 RepID=UPI0037232484
MPSIDTLLTAIRTCLDQTRELLNQISASKELAEDTRNELAAIGVSGSAAQLGATVSALEEGQGQTSTIAQKLEGAIAAAEAARGHASGTGGGGSGPPPTPPTPSPDPGPERPVPVHARRLAERLPVRESGDKTRLFAFTDEDGEAVEYASGRRRDARDGLKPDFARRFVVRDHAEGHVAADMRRPGGPEHVSVVINNEPCQALEGCDATIPHIIPKDATMTVYLAEGEATRHYRTYTGTGEGIE